ncbi:hypothetical protein BAC2_02458 [uncultured bacterium]|nr:hypothetical protein BAC2_02458 [uncultured bacterium]
MAIREHLKSGLVAGVVWGWLAYLTNALTGVFPFEGSFAQDIVSFSFGGAVFGVATGATVALLGRVIPFKGVVGRSIFASALIWILLRLTGDMLSMMEPDRYHLLTAETVQGLALSAALGAIFGLLARKAAKGHSPAGA